MRVLALAAGLPLAGCLSFETMDVRITQDPRLGGPYRGRYAMTLHNIVSDSERSAQSDFDGLIESWQGESYLLDRMADGCYVQRRDLRIERGIIVGLEEGLFAGTRALDLDTLAVGDSMFLQLRAGKNAIQATNGRIVDLEGERSVLWPVDAREVRYIVKQVDFKKAADLAPRLEAWKRSHDATGRR